MGTEKITSWIKATYDRLIAVVILACLTVSLLYLAVKIGVVRAQQATWEREVVNLVPKNPDAESVGSDEYKLAMSRLERPHIIPVGTWTRRLIVPEERFWCEDCKYPNPMDAKICASCQKELNDGKLPDWFDEDKDGIPNVKEEEYGLDPLDPNDAAQDKDGDGFDNLMEYKEGTDPSDPASKPSIEAWIVLTDMKAEAFNLLFKAYSTMPDGSRMFQLNTRTGGKTHFAKPDSEIEGFKVAGFETNFVQVTKPIRRTVDRSELTLSKGKKEIKLVKGKNVQWDEFNATIEYERTGQEFMLHQNDEFELEGNKYNVIRIDTGSQTVVLNRLSDNKEFRIKRKNSGIAVPPTQEESSEAEASGEKDNVAEE